MHAVIAVTYPTATIRISAVLVMSGSWNVWPGMLITPSKAATALLLPLQLSLPTATAGPGRRGRQASAAARRSALDKSSVSALPLMLMLCVQSVGVGATARDRPASSSVADGRRVVTAPGTAAAAMPLLTLAGAIADGLSGVRQADLPVAPMNGSACWPCTSKNLHTDSAT